MSQSNSEILKRIAGAKRKRQSLTHITDKSSFSREDRLKMNLCKPFVQFLNSEGMSLKKLSKLLKIPTPRLSEITNYKFRQFTVDKLVKNLELLSKHSSEVKAFLELFEQASESPDLGVTETRRFTKELRLAAEHHIGV